MEQPPVPPSNKRRRGITSYIPVRKTPPYFSGKPLTLPQSIFRDDGQLEPTSKPADEKTFKKTIKDNATLDAVREKQNTKLHGANERLQRDNKEMKDAITMLRNELEESERIRDAQME